MAKLDSRGIIYRYLNGIKIIVLYVIHQAECVPHVSTSSYPILILSICL